MRTCTHHLTYWTSICMYCLVGQGMTLGCVHVWEESFTTQLRFLHDVILSSTIVGMQLWVVSYISGLSLVCLLQVTGAEERTEGCRLCWWGFAGLANLQKIKESSWSFCTIIILPEIAWWLYFSMSPPTCTCVLFRAVTIYRMLLCHDMK